MTIRLLFLAALAWSTVSFAVERAPWNGQWQGEGERLRKDGTTETCNAVVALEVNDAEFKLVQARVGCATETVQWSPITYLRAGTQLIDIDSGEVAGELTDAKVDLISWGLQFEKTLGTDLKARFDLAFPPDEPYADSLVGTLPAQEN